jgi:hypothetical protein
MVCCANKLNAMSFTLCKLIRDYEKYMQSLGPWAQWYSVYLSLLHSQRCVPSYLSDVLVASTNKCLVQGQEYLEVKLGWEHEREGEEKESKCTLYVFTNASVYCNTLPKKYVAYVKACALAKVVKLCPGGGMEVDGVLKDKCAVYFEDVPKEETEHEKEDNKEEECEPFESSEPFDTMDFTTTTDIDGQNIQEVEKRLRQILDVTETNTEITDQ